MDTEACDHDFKPTAKVTPYGIFIPQLDEISTVLQFAQTMTWKGQHPVVKLVTQTYQTGIRLTKQAVRLWSRLFLIPAKVLKEELIG